MDSSRQAADHFGVQRCFELSAVTLAVVNIDDDLGTQVGWHYHENPHLTFILRGDVIEGTKKEVYHCSPGKLLFHGAFEPHYNAKLAGSARCLHVDFHQDYLKTIDATSSKLDGIFSIRNPQVKVSCYKLFSEAVISDDLSGASVQSLSLEILGQLLFNNRTERFAQPSWVTGWKKFCAATMQKNFRWKSCRVSWQFIRYISQEVSLDIFAARSASMCGTFASNVHSSLCRAEN